MLKQRVLTALVLLPIVLGAIWLLPTPAVFALFAAAALMVAWEWAALMQLPAQGPRNAYLAATAILLGAAWLGRGYWPWFMAAAFAWWCLAFFLLFGFPRNLQEHRPGAWRLGLLGQILVLPTILGVAVLHGMEDGRLKLIYTLALVWVADTGAYFAGRALGKHKLAPQISPGKTWEGVAGGLALCAVWALTAGAFAFKAQGAELAVLLVLSMLVAGVSIVGDLTESMFKRLVGVKDSGTLLPGHGGMLDRVDSLLAAVPTMALGLYLTGL
ncbi:MAG: phosphatidate cytidylyltransferase [Gammaproteobacteria bacterium]|nr:phosphatidate cytidylyltransferase [Gammaproteobacteria bacterium]